MLISFKNVNVGPMAERELKFAPHLNVFTGDNSLGKSFLLDMLWFGLTRQWPHDLNPKVDGGFPARPREIREPAKLTFDFRTMTGRHPDPLEFSFRREWGVWKTGKGALVLEKVNDGFGAANATVTIPRVAGRADVGLDFLSPVWLQAKGMPGLRKPVETQTADCSGTRAWMLADETSFCVAVDVRKPGGLKVVAEKDLPDGSYPRHDRIVLSFDNGQGGFTFAVDPFNHRFAAHDFTDEAVGEWTSTVSREASGWKAVVRIPFATVGVDPKDVGDLRFNLTVGTAVSEGDSRGWVFSLMGGRPFAPSTWSKLVLKGE